MGVVEMKKLLILLIAVFLLSACGNNPEVNENINKEIAKESEEIVLSIEEGYSGTKEIDNDVFFKYTDDYFMDEEKFNSFNGYEKGLVAKTSIMTVNYMKGRYATEEELKENVDEFYDILENGDETFTTN